MKVKKFSQIFAFSNLE